MKQTSLALSLAAAMALGAWTSAQENPSAPSATPSSNSAANANPLDRLGNTFESESAGISLRLPAGITRLPSSGAGDDIGQFGDEARKWQLKLTRVVRPSPTSLTSSSDNFGKPIPGYLDQTVAQIQRDLSGCKILRQDLTNIADGDPKVKDNVAMIAVRYTASGSHFLSQQAIIQASSRVFYLISLTSPASESSADDAPPDPKEREAVETFRQMLDTVRLLDTAKIHQDQVERLYRTRALFVNWTKSRLRAAMADEQWLRIIKNGRDIGYSYITEKPAGGVPRPLKADEIRQGKSGAELAPPGDGVLVGIRARTMTPITPTRDNPNPKGEAQVDSSTWMFVTPDRRLEDWSRITTVKDGTVDKDGKPVSRELDEFGSSSRQTVTSFDKFGMPGTQLDPKQPPVRIQDDYELNVTTISGTGASDPLNQQLPPWYLPQALGHLLPRLLPLEARADGAPKSYMFATFVPETRQVMTRYVDVGNPAMINFNGRTQRAVPISDRIGWHGSVTTHYMTLDGRYLGSENKDTHMLILPTDGPTLLKIWKGADLTKPGAVQRPRGSASAVSPGATNGH